MARVVIFANGVMADPEKVRAALQPSDVILCADGGTHHALALGLKPDLVIGDLDSMPVADRAALQSSGVAVRPHPRDKNETDLELALTEALGRKASHILIVGALGKRLDHTIGNISMIGDPALADVDIHLDDGLEELFFSRSQAEVQGNPGDIVSLLPWGGAVERIDTEGLKWPLRDETLHPEKTRGISNEMLGMAATIHIGSGSLLIIHRRQTQAENRAL